MLELDKHPSISRLEECKEYLGAQGPDPRDQPDHDTDPPVERTSDGKARFW